MNKEWADEIKEKLEFFDKKRTEIEKALSELYKELRKVLGYNVSIDFQQLNKQQLIWRVKLADFIFDISEKDITEQQTLHKDVDENFNPIVGETKIELKEALQNIILQKLDKS